MGTNVLLIEDDDRIRETTRWLLEDEGYVVEEAGSAERGLELSGAKQFDCVLVDLMLPGMNGFDCCRALRRSGDVPIIVLTARGDKFDVVAGLESGADDYVTKPFVGRELTARIRALLRRRNHYPASNAPRQIGDVEIAVEEGVVRKAGEEVFLTPIEFRLLTEMASAPGRVFSREVLLDQVWGYAHAGDGKLVDAHIYRLRSKIERDPSHPQIVLTVRGLGYKVAQ
jgi:DNA-binding response OmpR family regulator